MARGGEEAWTVMLAACPWARIAPAALSLVSQESQRTGPLSARTNTTALRTMSLTTGVVTTPSVSRLKMRCLVILTRSTFYVFSVAPEHIHFPK